MMNLHCEGGYDNHQKANRGIQVRLWRWGKGKTVIQAEACTGINRSWNSTGRSWNPAVLLRWTHEIPLQFQGHWAVVKALTSPPALFGTRTSQELLWASPWLVEEALIIFFFVHLTPRKLDSIHSWKKRTETTSRLVGSCVSWGVNSDSGPVWMPSLSVKQATLTAVILQTCL